MTPACPSADQQRWGPQKRAGTTPQRTVLQTGSEVSATLAPEKTLARPASENSNANLDIGEEKMNRQIVGLNVHPKDSANADKYTFWKQRLCFGWKLG